MSLPGLSESVTSLQLLKQESQKSWFEHEFRKKECVRFIPNPRDPLRCGCGRARRLHPQRCIVDTPGGDPWTPGAHTEEAPTDAYGTIEFQGAPHPTKAQYVRMSNTTEPALIMQLLLKQWDLELPNLLISIHGGIRNFDLQPKLKRVFRKGLLKAAKTTGAWIVSGGTNTGVMQHVGDALGDTLLQSRNNIVTIGVAPWGVIHNRKDLIGRDTITPYHAVASPKSNDVVLNSNHSYFLLVDDGIVNKFGCEVALRKRLEKHLSRQKITTRSGTKSYNTPMVCLVMEGGANTIRTVLECVTDQPPVPVVVCDGSGRAADLLAFTHKYAQDDGCVCVCGVCVCVCVQVQEYVLECVTDQPPVPVVVCDGSGRAADLLAFTHKYAQDDGTMQETLRNQLIVTIERTFKYTREQAEKVFIELMLCVKKVELITVFRMGEENQDIDLAILTALLKSQNASAPDQLSLALTWNRPDIARAQIFIYGQEWPEGALQQAMMDALVYDRVDFVKLLLENGVSMKKWLTIARLEELYNIGLKSGPPKSSAVYIAASNQKQDAASTLRYLIREGKKHIPANYRYTLLDIGLVVEKLMGGAYRASYCRKRFKQMYNAIMKKNDTLPTHHPRKVQFEMAHNALTNQLDTLHGHNICSLVAEVPLNPLPLEDRFKYPFSELMVWAVLLRRQHMAQFMWQHGEEAMAKALIACKLYKSMAHEAEQDDLEIDVAEEIKGYGREFAALAVELLEACYKTDDDLTQQLLTYKLQTWGDQTCLSLAVTASHRDFLANTSCQILLTDMWMGGLRMRKYTSLKVILGILFPPSFIFLEFKSKEELQLMPQTMEEHIQNQDSDSDDSSDSGSDGGRDGDDFDVTDARGETSRLESELLHPSAVSANGSVPNADLASSTTTGLSSIAANTKAWTLERKNSPLRFGKKMYEFYTAPIAKFWANAIGFLVFLVTYTYVVLVRMEPSPALQEWYIIAYILTFMLEKLREIMVSEPKKLSQKLKVYFEDFWNISDTFAICLFVAGIVMRLVPGMVGYGKVLYCISIIFWYVRIMDLFAVSKYLGPYVMMIGKMVKDMLSFIVILLIVLMSFGVVRQAITYPEEEPKWELLRDIFLKPYFMIYGEVYAGEIDPECGDGPEFQVKCVPGRFAVPAVMTIYLIVANILLINLLIAVFNNTFHQVNAISTQVWKFQRYSLVIEYESLPILPPPFIIVCHVWLLAKFLVRRCQGKVDGTFFDCALKLYLDPEDIERVHDFEEECMEDYFRERDNCFQSSTEERIRVTNQRVENLMLRLDDINQKENTVKLSLQTVDYRMAKLEEMSLTTGETMLAIQQQLAAIQTQLAGLTPGASSSEASRPRGLSSASTATVSSATPYLAYGVPYTADAYGHGFNPFGNSFLGASYPPVSGSSSSSAGSKHLNEQRLRPFTDYKRPRRPLFSRAVSVGTPVTLGRDYQFVPDGAQFEGMVHHPVMIPQSATPFLGSDLYQRRRQQRSNQHASSEDEELVDKVAGRKRQRPGDMRVKFRANHNSMPFSAHVEGDESSMKVSELSDITEASKAPNENSETQHPTETHHHPHHHMPSASKSPPSSSHAFVPKTQPPKSDTYAPSAIPKTLMPMTPIVTPTRMEYTSITDDIDTSCVNYRSPPGSPTMPHIYEYDADLIAGMNGGISGPANNNQRPSSSRKRQKKVPKSQDSVEQLLKSAEESVRAQMESIIRKRIRQISLTESDDLGELAKHVAQDMESSEEGDVQSQPSYHSDDEERNASSRQQQTGFETRMKSIKSEPALKNLLRGITRQPNALKYSKAKSLSPPIDEREVIHEADGDVAC